MTSPRRARREPDDIELDDDGGGGAFSGLSGAASLRGGVLIADAGHVEDARRALASVGTGEAKTDRDGRGLTVPVAGGSAVLVAAIRELDTAGVVVSDIGLRRPTLDDVFAAVTGSLLEGAASAAAPTR